MGCDWPVAQECLPPLPILPDTPTTDEQAAYDLAARRRNSAEDMAVSVLWALSGRQFGVCDTTVRPCPAPPFAPSTAYVLTRTDGHWFNWSCGCVGSCTVGGPRVVHLPGPVATVTDVTVDGIILSASEYRLEGDALYRLGTSWPGQDLGRPLGESRTWSVTYGRGTPVPSGVEELTGLLAKEFIVACDDVKKCRLPRSVVSTTQRGVTHVFDPSKILAAGYTGLAEVDMWLAAVNPHRLAAAPVVV
ncbi:hypothetical protein H7K45_27720 [Mycobacterium yunnanensis]|uniref:Head-to-tail adaptor n=1 Tax=Mycobacterium yunnanensis TaxID=368477 RepID=A0A9X3C4D8_9MYCO|nr:hypothetical protein [Mycobacterium yunnanensis]MCV7424341.1 hypothetical protein [Mycobacterium yunnanensis]